MSNSSVISNLLKKKTPELLFHYTTSVGLLGIIQTGKIWTTKIHYLNDRAELKLAFGYIREEIARQKLGIGKSRSDEELDKMSLALDDIQVINVSVASFTEVGDQLSQWRGYCDIGSGYSLGFNGLKLKNIVDRKEEFSLVPCVYKQKQHIRMVKELVDLTPVQNLEQHPNYGKPPFYKMSFSDAALFLAPIIKNKSFEEEKE